MGSPITENGVLLFPSEFMAAVDLKGRDWPLVIESVKADQLQMAGGKKMRKLVMRFKGASKKFVVNVTNQRTIAEIHGTEVTTWPGKSIALYPTKTGFSGKQVDCIRVRDQAPSGNGAATAPTQPRPAAVPDPLTEFMDGPAPAQADGKLLDDGMPSWQEFH